MPESPSGDSIFSTSAPQSDSMRTQVGPARTRDRSSTLNRASGVAFMKPPSCLFGGLCRRGPAFGDQLAGQRQQLAAIVDRVVQWIEAADQERRHAESVIIQQRLGYLARGA